MPDLSFLVVDDEERTTYLIEKILAIKFPESHIDVFNNPVDAVEMAKTRRYDLVLSDICMEGIDGFELCKQIKEFDKFVPVVLMSGSSYDPEFQKLAAENNAEIMQKPFNIHKLVEIINKYVLNSS